MLDLDNLTTIEQSKFDFLRKVVIYMAAKSKIKNLISEKDVEDTYPRTFSDIKQRSYNTRLENDKIRFANGMHSIRPRIYIWRLVKINHGAIIELLLRAITWFYTAYCDVHDPQARQDSSSAVPGFLNGQTFMTYVYSFFLIFFCGLRSFSSSSERLRVEGDSSFS